MKCPTCNYEHGWSPEKYNSINGEHGKFYTLSNNIHMERTDPASYYMDKKTLVGCPKCNSVFMGEDIR